MVSETINCNSVINNRIVFREIEDELVHFLRLNTLDRLNRTLSGSDTFTGDGNTTLFELTGDLDSKGRHKVMVIKSVKINGVLQTIYTDYVVGFRKSSPILGKIQFWNPPADGVSITVEYYHSYHFIYPEAPRVDLTSSSYPRISVQYFNSIPKDVAIGGKVHKYDIIMHITVVDITRDYVETIIQQIKDFFIREDIKHGFHNFDYIREPKLNPLIPNGEDPNDIVYIQQLELNIPNQYEFSR